MKLWKMTFRTQIAHVNSKNRKGSFWSVLVILINDCVCSLMIVGGTCLLWMLIFRFVVLKRLLH